MLVSPLRSTGLGRDYHFTPYVLALKLSGMRAMPVHEYVVSDVSGPVSNRGNDLAALF